MKSFYQLPTSIIFNLKISNKVYSYQYLFILLLLIGFCLFIYLFVCLFVILKGNKSQ
ncbi:transmembrane protein, putative (macronuclear) [Tetrahymena thermophila SB210]|uniref:Transmembrane protein, putative n=1 Tax=Tetrahymena thermophila (strain SB210) TaxID=312017 RepID=W7XIZ3_TETTS|nr:transmembrane protein, putative [Tetrahymena thermophila SB210]EWS73734.1 transmembrane protein, putative [Tetrahymena thermophila SB210]|eukprot:XP_012653772.1 transmembrane protein, putative [Tetrahymena thermophila SB210]